MCNDMYGFLTSKLDAPDYYEHRPDLVPKSYFPNSQQLARASMSLLAPEILFKIPLRLLNAMGGIDSVALLPNTRLLPRHFRIESIPPRMCKALAFASGDFTAPITLCYDDKLTVIVFRCFLSRDALEPIVTHWYTCLNEVEWYCEFSQSSAVEFHYDVLHNPYQPAVEPYTQAVQLGQTPPSPLSFFRPYDCGFLPYTRAHPTVWDAMEYLQTLVSARSVAHISITHQETFVRLAESSLPPVTSVLFALLDWARTQIRLPLLFGTMLPSWSAYIALESALAVNSSRQGNEVLRHDWVLFRVPLNEYRELCDDEQFALCFVDVMKRLPILTEYFFCPPMTAMHSLFSKGNRGLRPRITAQAVQSLQRASDILRHRLRQGSGCLAEQLRRKNIPALLQIFKDVSSEETRDFIPPNQEVPGFRTHEVMLFESCRLDSSFFDPEFMDDPNFAAHGEPSPEFMCNICCGSHWGNPNRVTNHLSSTHATRARVLREKCYPRHFHSRYQPTLCVLDPNFSQDLQSLITIAESSGRSITVEVTVPAYHEGNTNRSALLSRLGVHLDLTNDDLEELAAGRYYLHSVSLLLEPDMRVCFVCDIHYENVDYKYISLGPTP